jgi:hypothetical protein
MWHTILSGAIEPAQARFGGTNACARRRTACCCVRRATTTRSSFITCTDFGRTISEGNRDANSRAAGEARLMFITLATPLGPISDSPSSVGAGWPPMSPPVGLGFEPEADDEDEDHLIKSLIAHVYKTLGRSPPPAREQSRGHAAVAPRVPCCLPRSLIGQPQKRHLWLPRRY